MKLSPPARDLVSLIRRHRLNYDTLRVACHQARKSLSMTPPRRGRQLPKLLSDASLSSFFAAVDRSSNLQHQILLRLLFYTAIRVSELCHIRISDVDLQSSKVFIDSGKGDKDRYILFPDSFRLSLRAYIDGRRGEGEYLFESRQKRAYSTRRIQQIVEDYAEAAGIVEHVHPHLFRHQCLTWLTKHGLTDSQIQLISGHASKKSLELYQHMSLKDVSADYQAAARKLEI